MELVIFDMDGLMLDTERLYMELWPRVFDRGTPEESRQDYLGTLGLSRPGTAAFLQPLYPGRNVEAMIDRMEAISLETVARQGIALRPGLPELLEALEERNIPKVVATSSGREVAGFLLEKAGISHRFADKVFGDMVAHSKPAPDIFLLAANRMGADPARCLVLEDSPAGIRAAKSAGMTAVMIPDLLEPTPDILELADYRLGSLLEMIPLLDQL